MVPSSRLELDAARLWKERPPRIHNAKKQALFALMGGAARSPTGTLLASRWSPGELALALGPERPASRVASVDGPYTYADPGPETDAWHVNFADPELFAFYGGPAFAQDEIQVAEHPILASLREALKDDPSFPPRTRDGERPTPVLVRGAERFGAIDTRPPLAEPYGIYGQRLGRASDEALAQAVTRLADRHRTNLIAMAAPQGGGRYAVDELRDVLATAVTAFAAARVESAAFAPGARVRICTGHWGTGAFGGNRVLMAAAQLVAARLAEIDELLYYSLDADGVRAFAKGKQLSDGFAAGTSFDAVVATLDAMGFEWGRSDGN